MMKIFFHWHFKGYLNEDVCFYLFIWFCRVILRVLLGPSSAEGSWHIWLIASGPVVKRYFGKLLMIWMMNVHVRFWDTDTLSLYHGSILARLSSTKTVKSMNLSKLEPNNPTLCRKSWHIICNMLLVFKTPKIVLPNIIVWTLWSVCSVPADHGMLILQKYNIFCILCTFYHCQFLTHCTIKRWPCPFAVSVCSFMKTSYTVTIIIRNLASDKGTWNRCYSQSAWFIVVAITSRILTAVHKRPEKQICCFSPSQLLKQC